MTGKSEEDAIKCVRSYALCVINAGYTPMRHSGLQLEVPWKTLALTEFPQPGMVVVQPATGPNGHMGIMDFDGMAISAQTHGVTRASNAAVWRPLVCRAYKEN